MRDRSASPPDQHTGLNGMAGTVIRQRLVFHGDVQGVGFRWHARMAAEALGVTGWVRNEWDGTVTMELQGTRMQIDSVIREVENGSFIRISEICRENIPPEEHEYYFQVR